MFANIPHVRVTYPHECSCTDFEAPRLPEDIAITVSMGHVIMAMHTHIQFTSVAVLTLSLFLAQQTKPDPLRALHTVRLLCY